MDHKMSIYLLEAMILHEDPITHDIINGEWRDTQQLWQPIARGSNRPPDDAKAIREILVEYYNSKDGEVPWQYSFI